MRDYRDLGREVQRDPYNYFLSQSDKQYARNVPFRMMFNAAALGITGLYFITRHNSIHRLKNLSISLDLVFGLAWRMVIAGLVADQASRRMFVNQQKLKEHKMAENEIKKIMVRWPNAKQLPASYKKANSYFWV